MAQMRVLEKQKEKADIEIATLERIQTETRTLIQKTFDASVKTLVNGMKGSIKDQIVKDLKPMLKQEMDDAMQNFITELTGAASTEIQKAVKSAMPSFSAGPPPFVGPHPGGYPGPPGERTGMSKHRVPYAARVVMRANIGNKRAVKSMITRRRQSVRGGPPPLEERQGSERSLQVIASTEGHTTTPLLQEASPQAAAPKPKAGQDAPAGGDAHATTDNVASGGESDVEPPPLGATQPEELYEVVEEPPDGLHQFLTSEAFDYFIGAVIVFNAVVIGFRTDYLSRHVGEEAPQVFQMCDLVTMFIFLCELAMKLQCFGHLFFFGEDWYWNIFDMSIVMLQLSEVVMQLFTETNLPGSFRALRLIRIIRILRVLRLIRLVRLVRLFVELRMIGTLLVETGRSLFGAIAMLLLVLYLTGVCVTEEVLMMRETEVEAKSQQIAELEASFGTLDRTMLSLYQSTTNGLAWGSMMDTLTEGIGSWMAPIFCFYIAFFTFAMANVITGIFVKQSVEAAQEAQDDAMVQQINNLFNKQDALGDLAYDDYTRMIKLPEMESLFKAINIDPCEAPLLYRLLDENGDGVLGYEEFINGALRLRGPAKSLELAMLMKETGEMNRWIGRRLDTMDQKMNETIEKIQEGHDKLFKYDGRSDMPRETSAASVTSQEARGGPEHYFGHGEAAGYSVHVQSSSTSPAAT